MITKEAYGYLSLVLTVISVAPYYYSIAKNRTRPHAFSWLIWGILAAIGFAAQAAKGAGPGAWGNGAGAFACFSITIIALFKGEHGITRSDWITFVAALPAIPCWIVTHDPLYAVMLISVIDVLAYYPTFRKSYSRPHEEAIIIHLVGALKYIVSLCAIVQWSLTTWLYPAVIAVTSLLLTLMLVIRRLQLGYKL